jgi:hypothetical protein
MVSDINPPAHRKLQEVPQGYKEDVPHAEPGLRSEAIQSIPLTVTEGFHCIGLHRPMAHGSSTIVSQPLPWELPQPFLLNDLL